MTYTTTLGGKMLYEQAKDGVIVRTKRMIFNTPTGVNNEVFERMFMDKEIMENLLKELPNELSRIGEQNEGS